MLVFPLYLFTRTSAFAYFMMNIIATAATAVAMMHILLALGFRARASVLASLAYALASLSWFYASKTPHEHALAIAGIVCAVYFTIRYQQGMGKKYLIYACLALGFGFIVRYDVILAAVPLGAYLYLGRSGERREARYPLVGAAIVAALALAPFLMANMTYNLARFGAFFESGYAGSTGAPGKLFGLEFLPRGLIGAILSPGRSIFLFSPVLMLFPFLVRSFARRVPREFFVMYVSLMALFLVFYSLHHSWDGDWCFGPRYFLVLNPFMLMTLAPMFERFSSGLGRVARVAVVVLLVASVMVQVTFVASNSNASNMMKFGVDDDSQPELSARYRRSFGEHGSWEWLASYFPLKYSQFLNQIKVFWYTALIAWDYNNGWKVRRALEYSDSPFLAYYMQMFMTFDLWWLQPNIPIGSMPIEFQPASLAVGPRAALVPAGMAFMSLVALGWAFRRVGRE
jgi:hypothetical protein